MHGEAKNGLKLDWSKIGKLGTPVMDFSKFKKTLVGFLLRISVISRPLAGISDGCHP